MSIAATALTLFLVFDPFGNMATFHTVLDKVAPEKRRQVMLRELVIALLILAGFLLAGSSILSILGVRDATLSISGGILLFLIALGMVFPTKSILQEPSGEDPFIVPLAVPLIAGPSAIALLLLLAKKYPQDLVSSATALLIAWAASACILLVSPTILKLLGAKGTKALERLMGLVLILIAVQMFLDGLTAYSTLSDS